jgi:uncharacterized protein YcbK (DUF882 family)
MTNKNSIWTTEEVELHLKSIKNGQKLTLPNNAYATKDFTWNELLRTQNRNIDMSSRQILENLKSSVDVLQNYRNEIGRPITITSSWRTPSEQQRLRSTGRKPSDTSLHLEGLALDFEVQGKPLGEVHKFLDSVHVGEVEYGNDYTHISLPTFSKNYLERKGIYNEQIYRNLDPDLSSLPTNARNAIIKRFTEKAPNILIKDNFNKKQNEEIFNGVNINLMNHKSSELPDSSLSNRIFTREDIGSMSTAEFAKYEQAINRQMETIGIPNESQAKEAVQSGNMIYVQPYTRADGTEVRGYYRAK